MLGDSIFTFSEESTASFSTPWSTATAATIATLPLQVQKLLKEFSTLLWPSAATPKTLDGVVKHIDTGSNAPMLASPQRLDPEKHRITEEEFLTFEKSRYYSTLELALGIPKLSHGCQQCPSFATTKVTLVAAVP